MERYRGEDWKEARQKTLTRDSSKCQICGQSGNSVHHIVKYSKSKSNDLGNLVTLCRKCHRKEENMTIRYGLRRNTYWVRKKLFIS